MGKGRNWNHDYFMHAGSTPTDTNLKSRVRQQIPEAAEPFSPAKPFATQTGKELPPSSGQSSSPSKS